MKLRIFFATLSFLLAGCGGVLDMPDKMDQSNEKQSQMLAAIHKQTLMLALDHMFSDENTKYLTPAPTGMMPFGQAFASEMHEDEFVQLVDLYMQDINTTVPDDSQKDSTGKWPATVVASVDREKTIKFYAIMIISGFASQDLINQVVSKELISGGQYTSAASAILEARSLFIHDILLEVELLTNPLDTPDKISKAVEYARYLDDIATLPFASTIELKISGMLSSDDNSDNVFDPTASTPIWAQIDQAFDTDLQKKYKSPTMAALRQQVEQTCRAHGAWDNKKNHCSPTQIKPG